MLIKNYLPLTHAVAGSPRALAGATAYIGGFTLVTLHINTRHTHTGRAAAQARIQVEGNPIRATIAGKSKTSA